MNSLKNQFLGFMHTPSLFQELQGLIQFEPDINQIKAFDDSLLHIPSKLPLGKRIEHFFKIYIQQSNSYDLIQNNIQIINHKETLGELDFLLYDKQKEQYIHVEHVYKYYLYDETFEKEIDRFIGSNRDDTFALKLVKLKEKQLPLLYKSETQNYLNGIDIKQTKQQVCFKGNIYVPMHLLGEKLPIINNACIKGFYINYQAFLLQEQFRHFEYFLPARYDWVSDCKFNTTWKSFDEIKDEIKLFINHKKSSLVWMRNKEENTCQSFFVTWW